MYNVKGPSKIVAKTTRRRLPQNMDNIREYGRNKSVDYIENCLPTVSRPVFHKKSAPHHNRQAVISPQHEEIIKFINESWNQVRLGLSQDSEGVPNHKSLQSVYYEEDPVRLEDFKPFDLESWWGKRLYACITGASKN